MFNLPIQKNDLTRDVPQGMTLKGFSAPVFDGVNYFRRLDSSGGALSFTVAQEGYVQLSLQPYSRATLNLAVRLDGQLVSTLTPPAGQFVASTLVIPASSGNHTLTLSARCGKTSCRPDTVAVYWLKLDHLTSPAPIKQVGWHAVEWRGDAVNPALAVSGTTRVQFDGVNLYRKTTGPVHLSWKNKSALSLNFETFTPKPLAHSVRVIGNGQTIYQKAVDAGVFFNHQVDLKTYSGLHDLTLELICGGQSCQQAQLYFPRLLVSTVTPGQGMGANLPLALGALVVLLVVLGWWLRLGRRRAPVQAV